MANYTGVIGSLEQSIAYQFGDHGFRYLTAGQSSPEGEHFFAIFANEAAVISGTSVREGTGAFAGMPIPAGATVFGSIKDVTCTSGKITCYLTKPV